MRKLKMIELCGEVFTIKTKVAFIHSTLFEKWKTPYFDRDALYYFYKKPSGIKQVIWDDWCDWAAINNAYLEIGRANGWAFTIVGLMQLSGKWYYIDITKSHNWLFPIEIIDD